MASSSNTEENEEEVATATSGSEQTTTTTTTATTPILNHQNHVYPVITNSDGAPVSFGDDADDDQYIHLLHCGRRTTSSVTGDNRCSSSRTRQCLSCDKLQKNPKHRMEMLRLIFPNITTSNEAIFVAALREKRGDVFEVSKYLIDMGAPDIPLEQAFPSALLSSDGTAPLQVVDVEHVLTVQNVLGYDVTDEIKKQVVESALRRMQQQTRNGDQTDEQLVQAAIGHIMDATEEELQQAVAQDASQQIAYEQEQAANSTGRKELLDQRDRDIERIKQLPIPDEILALAAKVGDPFGQEAKLKVKPKTTMTEDHHYHGHCMVSYDNISSSNGDGDEDNNAEVAAPPYCRICACKIPSQFTGTSMCKTCGLCEGCISSGNIMFWCPSIGNGGHLHPHPLYELYPASSRRGNQCFVKGENCLQTTVHHGRYVCSTCDFNVCKNCISQHAPNNYDRQKGKIILNDPPPSQPSPEQQQNEDSTNSTTSSSTGHPTFDPAERAAAAKWEGMPMDNEEEHPAFIVGTGQVGLRQRPTRRNSNQVSSTTRDDVSGVTGRVDTKILLPDNSDALKAFSNSISDVASNIHHVEHLLLQSQEATSGSSNSNTSRAIRQAVTAGKVGIAGTLLLANQYAPKRLLQKKRKSIGEDDNNNNDDDDAMVCFCGNVVDPDTAPDGAIGCLNGHGMHPGCAADHLLGGGGCPFCNAPLFYPSLPTTEAMAAKALAQTKLEERKSKIMIETKRKNEELAAQGINVAPKLNDLVRISSDIAICAVEVTKYSKKCGWNNFMKESCGMIGRVNQVCESSDEGDEKQVACRVHIQDHNDYYWTPSVLTVICRADSNEYVLFKEAAVETVKNKELVTAANAENHISHLQAELQVLVTARLKLEDSTKATSTDSKSTEGFSFDPPCLKDAKGLVSHFDWCRAKHLLRLADQWKDEEKAIGTRQSVNAAVREGDIDTASRIIRRYNAFRVSEDLQWADAAASKGKEYLVEKFAKVDLLAWPSVGAPKTGYWLEPSTRFVSRSEIIDDDGNLWVQVDDTLLAALPKYEGVSPPQGWLCAKPSRRQPPALVRRARSALRCFGCGDGLVPVGWSEKYFDVKHDHKLSEGDELLVAATLVPVRVVSANENIVFCSFSNQSNSPQKMQKGSLGGKCNFMASYRREDLLYPKGREALGQNRNEEHVLADECPCSRRDLIRTHDCSHAAKKVWEDAKKQRNVTGDGRRESRFASCVRGHLLHARCFQAALLAGQCCPAAGCSEPLWIPRVRREQADEDTCCGPNNSVSNGDDLVGQTTTFLNLRSASNSEADLGPTEEGLKMCPLCLSGPFVHTECSDMVAHHGQCLARALGGTTCHFSAAPGEIAAKLMGLSENESISDALPQCPTHKVPVMFNGCLNCGHLFTEWNDLPDWDRAAKAAMDVDKAKREQAKLLAAQIREESSLLQFDRGALGNSVLGNTWGEIIVGREAAGKPLSLPLVPPPADDFL